MSDHHPAGAASEAFGADRQLHAQDSDRVYQAAGDQHFYDRATPAPAKVTNTLPRDTAAFTGRDQELQTLITTVTAAAAAEDVIPIHAVDGMPGVGKTAFVIHVGHLLAERFPDGQLFIDLHAHTAGQGPVEPADALFALLSADGMLPAQIPAGLDERAACWRARMAGKKVLVIMDNAAGRAQVESLVPGAAGNLVLITSRRRLPGLGARHAAITLSLNTLPPDDAAALFIRLAGRDRTAETAAVTDLVRLCGHLPLAISLLAAKLRPEPLWRFADLVDDLVAAQDRLAPMRAEDIEVKAAFDLSYHALPAVRRRFFRRLGLHPGTDVDAYAAAAVNGVGLSEAREHLTALYNDHLVDQPVRGRYRMHDLIGEYARVLVAEDAPTDRTQAVTQVMDYYQHTANLAGRHLSQRRWDMESAPEPPDPVPDISTADQAMAWLSAERANLLACTTYAEATGQHARLVRLATALAAFLRRTGPWREAVILHRAAAAAACYLGDQAAQAQALHSLGIVLRRVGDYSEATQVLSDALICYNEIGDCLSSADALTELATLYRLIEDFPAAKRAITDALATYRDLGDRLGEAAALNNLAVVRWLTDDCPGADRALRRALGIYQGLEDRFGQANTLFGLGVVRRMSDDYSAARHFLEDALIRYRDLGDRLGQANVRHNLGVIERITDDYPGAIRSFQEASAIYHDLGDRLGQANASKHLGIALLLGGDLSRAGEALAEALTTYQALGDRLGQAGALCHLATVWRQSADLPSAARALQDATAIYEELGNLLGQAEVRNQRGALLLDVGDVDQAREHYELALRLARQAQRVLEEARAIEGIARCALEQQMLPDAVALLREALDVYRRIGVSDAYRVAAQLDDLNTPLAS
jgi:tetratricopeptide (TPR) repeat protein/DNA-binding transcriptional ArsR family regulator